MYFVEIQFYLTDHLLNVKLAGQAPCFFTEASSFAVLPPHTRKGARLLHILFFLSARAFVVVVIELLKFVQNLCKGRLYSLDDSERREKKTLHLIRVQFLPIVRLNVSREVERKQLTLKNPGYFLTYQSPI